MDELPPSRLTYDRRAFMRRAGVSALGVASIGAFGAVLDACGSSSGAKLLNTIALRPDWANYGQIMKAFQRNYGIKITNAHPPDSSAEELTAMKNLKGHARAPDVIDVSPSVAIEAAQEGLLTPYKVKTWSSIPNDMKDPEGRWYGDYFGVVSFGTNTDVVKDSPRSWSDLTKPQYKGKVAIDGNPALATGAFAAVWAAALGNGGSLDDIMPGIKFFQDLKRIGNFNPADCRPSNIAKGSTPIAIVWDYLSLGYAKQFKDKPNYTVSIPTDGKFGNFYCQAINQYGPHPNEAESWEEFIYSDEVQLLYLAGLVHPVRYADLARRGIIPSSLSSKLPPPSEYDGVQFPNEDQSNSATASISQYWSSMVGG